MTCNLRHPMGLRHPVSPSLKHDLICVGLVFVCADASTNGTITGSLYWTSQQIWRGFRQECAAVKIELYSATLKNCMQFVCNRAHCLIKILHEYTLVSKFATVGKSLQKRLRCKIVDFLLQRCGWYLGRKWAIFGCDSFHHSRPRSGGYVKD